MNYLITFGARCESFETVGPETFATRSAITRSYWASGQASFFLNLITRVIRQTNTSSERKFSVDYEYGCCLSKSGHVLCKSRLKGCMYITGIWFLFSRVN